MSIAPGSIVTDGLASSTVVPTPTMTTSVTTSAVSSSLEALYMPITTSWETPLSCTWTFDISQTPEPGTPGPIAFLDMEPVPGASSLSCYPDGMFYGNQTGTFSPATCPNGWTTVSLRQDENAVETMATTTAVCCSSEYTLDGSICKREQPTVLAVPMVYNTTDGSHTVLADETSTLTSATLAVHTIQALFRNSDKQMLGLTDEDSIRDDSDSSKSHGLSLGARIGIGIGVTVGGVFLIALGLLLLLMRNRRASDEKEAAAAAAARNSDDPEGRMRGAPAVVEVPPPAYEFSVRNSVTDDDDNFSGEEDLDDDESIVQVDDIEALRAQKAAIQRRIEELESVDAADDRR